MFNDIKMMLTKFSHMLKTLALEFCEHWNASKGLRPLSLPECLCSVTAVMFILIVEAYFTCTQLRSYTAALYVIEGHCEAGLAVCFTRCAGSTSHLRQRVSNSRAVQALCTSTFVEYNTWNKYQWHSMHRGEFGCHTEESKPSHTVSNTMLWMYTSPRC